MLPQEEKNAVIQRELTEGTIKTVATLGLENTTTDAICKSCGVNVAYIYRFFSDKEDLIAKSFDYADERLLRLILDNYTVLNYGSIDYESRCHVLFRKCWDYLMAHPDDITFYIRYYYSSSFRKYSLAEHMKRYAALFEKMRTAFPETTDVSLVLRHVLNTLLCEAARQVDNPCEEDDDAVATKTFYLIFSVVKAHVNQEKFRK